jgi:hypothetical protein
VEGEEAKRRLARMETNKDLMITRAGKWIGSRMDNCCARRGRTADEYDDKGVDKTIPRIRKMQGIKL